MDLSPYKNHAGQTTNIKTANKFTENIAESKQNVNRIEDDIGKALQRASRMLIVLKMTLERHCREQAEC